MAGHVALCSLKTDSILVQRCCWTYCYTSVLLQCRNLLKTDTVAWSSCPTITLCRHRWKTGRRITLQVHAAKPGFGAQPQKKSKKVERTAQEKKAKDPVERAKQILAKKKQALKEDSSNTEEAPSLSINEVAQNYNALEEEVFERRLADISRAAAERKILADQKKYGPINYDAPLPSTPNGLADNLGAKVGIGLAVVIFGLIFALGDFLPSGSPPVKKSSVLETKQLSKEETSKLQAQVQEFEDLLKISPEDRNALEGAAVSYAELGEYDKSAQYLTNIIQKLPGDVEAHRLLAEVQNGKGDYDASISSYRAAIRFSGKKELSTLLQGLTNSLLAAKKPSEAVGELLAAKARLKYNFEQIRFTAKQALLPPTSDGGSAPEKLGRDMNTLSAPDEHIDPVTLELLLGKAYAAWNGHISDAVSVYDGLITSYPEDYRGYLAKGVLLKGQNKQGDAERMFIQARYLAPSNSKSIVDIYSGRQSS